MLTAKQFSVLKQNNVSVNHELSKERILDTFKNATKEQKNEIVKISGISKSGFYKTSGSPKSVLALACVLGVSPFYLSCESDDMECNDDIIKEFYKKCISSDKKSVKAKPKTAKEKTVKDSKKPSAEMSLANPSEKDLTAISETKSETVPDVKSVETPIIDDDSLVSLLRALSIRAKFSGEAETTYNAVVELLIK